MNEETKTLITFIRHIELVKKSMLSFSRQLETRAQIHDLSKFKEDEFGGFVEINQIARKYPYGSEEYKASIRDNDAVTLHYSRNSHHPEFHPVGIDEMGLLDLVEMVCDWKAASETYGQTSFKEGLEKSIERFKPGVEQEYVIRLIARELE